jgi:hypothetical protein
MWCLLITRALFLWEMWCLMITRALFLWEMWCLLFTRGLSIYLWLYSPCGPCPLFQFLNLYTVRPTHWREISPSQSRYLHTEPHKQRINAPTDIHASSRIRNHDPSVRAIEDGSCLRPRGHCDRHTRGLLFWEFCCSLLHALKDYGKNERENPRLINLGRRWRRVTSLTLRSVYPDIPPVWTPESLSSWWSIQKFLHLPWIEPLSFDP